MKNFKKLTMYDESIETTASNSTDPLLGVGGIASQFEEDIFKLINAYVNKGLSKPDLVRKMKWITGNCEMS